MVTLKKMSTGSSALLTTDKSGLKYKLLLDSESGRSSRSAKLSQGSKRMNITTDAGVKDSSKVARKNATNIVRDIEKAIKNARKAARDAIMEIRNGNAPTTALSANSTPKKIRSKKKELSQVASDGRLSRVS